MCNVTHQLQLKQAIFDALFMPRKLFEVTQRERDTGKPDVLPLQTSFRTGGKVVSNYIGTEDTILDQ